MNALPNHHPSATSRRRLTVGFGMRVVITYFLVVVVITHLHATYSSGSQFAADTSVLQDDANTTPVIDTATRRALQSNGWTYDFSNLSDGPLPEDDWNFEVGTKVADYNNEAQAYTDRPRNVRIEDGTLVIEAHREKLYGKEYTSARIDTRDVFDFTHGTLEIEAMLPRGKGTWPAAWLMPADTIYQPRDYGVSPSDPLNWVVNGEIDFLEAIGSIPGENIPAAHSYNQMQRSTIYTPGRVATPYSQYHRYGIIKSPNKIEFTIDGEVFTTRTKTSDNPLDWPFEQPYYLILNLALGGSWAGADGIDDSTAPWQLKIKSITYTPHDEKAE